MITVRTNPNLSAADRDALRAAWPIMAVLREPLRVEPRHSRLGYAPPLDADWSEDPAAFFDRHRDRDHRVRLVSTPAYRDPDHREVEHVLRTLHLEAPEAQFRPEPNERRGCEWWAAERRDFKRDTVDAVYFLTRAGRTGDLDEAASAFIWELARGRQARPVRS